ncbi:MAG TPA: biopolymer transporter ExbD [Acidobacteriota bacterium]|nr:biopolymer transporter ExbD [Acidobacteriota bacterium]
MAMTMGNLGSLKSDINVTPLVDVVLVLLIIFMVLTPLLQMGYDVNVPPKATADTSLVMSKEQLIVTQRDQRKVFLNRIEVDVTQLPLKLTDILKHRSDKTVFYAADDELNYGVAMQTMDMIRTAGAERIGIITEKMAVPN